MTGNLDTLFRQTARRQPEHAALLGPGRGDRLTYGELDRAIGEAAEQLSRAGLAAGHCVGLHVPSGRDYIVFNYAVWRCGGCVVPIPVELTDDEKQEIVREIALDFAISTPAGLDCLKPFQTAPARELPAGLSVLPIRGPRRPPPEFSHVNAAFIRFTSGTTGASKGVVLSHESIHERILAANAALRLTPDDRVVWLLSMSYHFAVSIVGYLTFGATIVLAEHHLGQSIADCIERHGGTFVYGSPLHCALLADAELPRALSSLRLVISTASSLDAEIAARFQQRVGLPITQALGIIEVGLPCINVEFAAERPQAVGRVLPAYRLQLRETPLSPDLRELCFSGPGLLDAYYEPWQSRDDFMPDGWFHTGDIGEVDADGCVFVRGRSKDVINVLGMKFFPRELEAVLESHPAVREARVFARRHARLGEVPEAQVVVADDAAEPADESSLLALCRQRLSPFKVPQRIEFVEQLPRTASGKLLHRETPSTRSLMASP